MSLGPDKSKRIFDSAPKLSGRLQSGAVVDGRYRVMSFLGKGGMCVVYKAEHLNLHRLVALKLLPGGAGAAAANQERLGRFQREAMALAGLKHPNIVEVFGCGLYEQHTYMALEFLEGQSLADMLTKQPGHRLLKEQALPLFLQICDALEHAHVKGLIHRDLKPSNVMICSGDRVKLIDFGISKLFIDSSKDLQTLTQTGQLIGSVHYMSPEQCMAKQLDARSDIYSLGCLMYEALCGRPPFLGDTPIALLAQHLNVSAADTAELKDAFGSVILSCLEKNPENRPQSAKQLRDLLIDPQTHRPVRVVRKRAGLKISKPLVASATMIATTAIVVLAIAACCGCLLLRQHGSSAVAVTEPTRFASKEECLQAVDAALRDNDLDNFSSAISRLPKDSTLDVEDENRVLTDCYQAAIRSRAAGDQIRFQKFKKLMVDHYLKLVAVAKMRRDLVFPWTRNFCSLLPSMGDQAAAPSYIRAEIAALEDPKDYPIYGYNDRRVGYLAWAYLDLASAEEALGHEASFQQALDTACRLALEQLTAPDSDHELACADFGNAQELAATHFIVQKKYDKALAACKLWIERTRHANPSPKDSASVNYLAAECSEALGDKISAIKSYRATIKYARENIALLKQSGPGYALSLPSATSQLSASRAALVRLEGD